jgi:hypothetical protein
MHLKGLWKAIGGAALAAGFALSASAALADEGCGDFQPVRGKLGGMELIDHAVYVTPGMGAAVTYSGDDGVVIYRRFDMGFDTISDRALMLAAEQSVESVSNLVRGLSGQIVRIRQSGTTRTVNEVEVKDFVVLSRVGTALGINVLGIGSDGHCLHEIHYAPNMQGVGRDGHNAEDLLVFERFERAMNAMAVYFCRESCVTEM